MASDGRDSGAAEAERDVETVLEKDPEIGADGRDTLARSLSKEEDMLQVQLLVFGLAAALRFKQVVDLLR